MAWREIDVDDETWYVQPAAERRANQSLWQLTLSFRSTEGENRKSFWATYPIESTSKSSIFTQAENITDEVLKQVLTEHEN